MPADAFWQQCVPTAIAAGVLPRSHHLHPDQRYINFPAGWQGLLWGYHRRPYGVRVNLHIYTPDPAVNQRILNDLSQRRESIEAVFGDRLSWTMNRSGAIIAYDMPRGGKRSPDHEWSSAHREMVEAMRRLQAALHPHLAAVL
jgi:hypothetical protein